MGSVHPFVVKDCALVRISTGLRAQSLRDLREGIAAVDVDCIYYHFWGNKIAPGFEEQEYNNDFARWVKSELHDPLLAERLAVVDPSEFSSLEELREELVDIIDQRLDELDYLPVSTFDKQFHFIKGFIVVFDTYKRVSHPRDMCIHIPKMSLSSIFYHFVDARRRHKGALDDFRVWLLEMGDEYRPLVDRIAEIDPFFMQIAEIRDALEDIFRGFFMEI